PPTSRTLCPRSSAPLEQLAASFTPPPPWSSQLLFAGLPLLGAAGCFFRPLPRWSSWLLETGGVRVSEAAGCSKQPPSAIFEQLAAVPRAWETRNEQPAAHFRGAGRPGEQLAARN